jgi:transcriptional regulator with XRE-family HTH domain
MTSAGLSVGQVAERVGVDPKTVERWVSRERLPHRTHRWSVCSLLEADEAYLWPELLNDPRTQSASQAEFVALYPHRGSVPAELWSRFIEAATDSVDVLVYSGLFLFDSQDGLVDRLVTKARAGTKTRLLFGDPSSEAVAMRGDEEGIGANMATRIRLSLDAVKPALSTPGVEVRTHATPLYNSMYRFDEHLLVNIHAYGSQAPHNPVMHLRRVPGGRMFDHFMLAFDRVWAKGHEVPASRPT